MRLWMIKAGLENITVDCKRFNPPQIFCAKSVMAHDGYTAEQIWL